MFPIVRSGHIRAILLLGAACLTACSGGLDQGAVPCRNDGECPTGAYCAAGGKCAAAPSCAATTKLCHDRCLDLQSDVANCGACGQVCQAPASGSATCEAGACGFTCTAPAVKANGACVSPPAAPVNVRARPSTNVAVTWDAASDATSWVVKRSPTGAGQSEVAVSANSFTDTAVAPGSTESYQIVAVNAAGRGPASAAVSATTAPAAPSGLAATAVSAVSVSLSWSRVAGATSYSLLRSTTSGAESTAVATAGDPGAGTTVSAADNSVQASTQYFYVVVAANNGGALTSGNSNEVTATIPTPVPVNVVATPTDDTHVVLTWSPAASATSYDIYRGTASGGESPLTNVALPGFTDSGLTADNVYFYKVFTRHNAQSSLPSNEVTARTLLVAPTSLAVAASNDGSITLTFMKPSGGPFYYELFRGFASGQEVLATPPFNPIRDSGTAGQQTFSDVPLAPATSYFYRIRARNPAGNSSALSNGVSGTTTNASPPTSLGLNAVDDTHVQITLNHITGLDLYDFYRSNSSTAPSATTPPTFTVTQAAGPISLTDTLFAVAGGGPPPPTYYSVRARYSGNGTATPWSSPSAVQFALGGTVPGTPTGSVLGAGGNVVLLNWSTPGPSTTYTLYRETNPNLATFANVVASGLVNPYFTDTTVLNGSTYYYRVAATSPRGSSAQSAVFPSAGATVDPNAFVATRGTSYFSDGPDVVVPGGFRKLAVVVPQATGSPVTTLFTCNLDGYCVATGIPPTGGVYVHAAYPTWVYTTARTMDLGREAFGRATASQGYSTLTPLSITLSNLAPFTAADRLELTCGNSGAGSEDLQQIALSSVPAIGATQLDQFSIDLFVAGNTKSLDTTFGDRPFLTQQTAATSSTGVPYVTVSRIYSFSSFSPVDGRATSAGGSGAAFSNVSNSTTAAVFYPRSQFKALAPQINPNASVVGTQDLLQIHAASVGAGPVQHHLVGYPFGDILTLTFDAGTSDVNAGNVSFGNPFPSSWQPRFMLYSPVSVSVNHPTLKPYVTFTGYEYQDLLVNALPLASAANGLVPLVGPPSNPQIKYVDSGNVQRTVSAFNEVTGVGLTPTLAWSPPTSGARVPTYYRIFVTQIGDTGDSSGVAGFLDWWQFYTLGTSLTIPPGVLAAGGSYFAEIRAGYEPGRDPTMTPLSHRSPTVAFAPVVTARFAP